MLGATRTDTRWQLKYSESARQLWASFGTSPQCNPDNPAINLARCPIKSTFREDAASRPCHSGQAWEVRSLTSRSGLVQSIAGHCPGSRARQLKHGQGTRRRQTQKKGRRGDVVPCLPQLFTVSAAFSATLPLVSLVHPASWQTDGRGDDQTTRPPRVV